MQEQAVEAPKPKRGRPTKQEVDSSLKKYHGFIRVMVPSANENDEDIPVDNGFVKTLIVRDQAIVVPAHAIVPLAEARVPIVKETKRFGNTPASEIPAGVPHNKHEFEYRNSYPTIQLHMPTKDEVKAAEKIFGTPERWSKVGLGDGEVADDMAGYRQAKQVYARFVELSLLTSAYETFL